MSEVKNKEVKYKYAIDETGEMVSIYQYNNIEDYKHHSYKCASCGRELLPRALQSKYKQRHFYHFEPVECSGEQYLHKLGKYLIKKKFDEEEHFYISLIVKETEECNKIECPLRNRACEKYELASWHDSPIDLKEDYDTCTEEAYIDGKRADLLLTNSKNTQTPPILIEIWYTHQCEVNKIETGHRIIELKIQNEQDIINIYNQAVWYENIQNIAFIHLTIKR